MAQQGQSKLENITSTSFPANHLLQFSVVKQETEQSYKKQYFFFITLAPGAKTQDGGRTFDFNNRVTMKVEAYQIKELAHAIRAYARGQEQVFGPHSIYVDTGKSAYGQQGGGQGKSLSIQKTATQQRPNGPPPSPTVTFFFKSGSNQALGYSMSPYRALAVADEIEELAKYCNKLEQARGPVAAHSGAFDNPNFANQVPAAGPFGGQESPQPFAGTPPFGQPAPGPASNVAGNFANTFNNFPDDDIPF